MEHPFFLAPYHPSKLLLSRNTSRPGRRPRSETASDRADVPGGRVRRVIGRIGSQSNHRKGGLQMAKKAKGGKKKASKKR